MPLGVSPQIGLVQRPVHKQSQAWSLETNSANEIRVNWLELKFKLIIINLTLFVNRAQVYHLRWEFPPKFFYSFTCIYIYIYIYVLIYLYYILELLGRKSIWLWQTFSSNKNDFNQAKVKDAWWASQRGLPINRTTNPKCRKCQSQPLSLTPEQFVFAGSRRLALAETTGTTVYTTELLCQQAYRDNLHYSEFN